VKQQVAEKYFQHSSLGKPFQLIVGAQFDINLRSRAGGDKPRPFYGAVARSFRRGGLYALPRHSIRMQNWYNLVYCLPGLSFKFRELII